MFCFPGSKTSKTLSNNSVRKSCIKKLHPYLIQIYLLWILLPLKRWFNVSIPTLPSKNFLLKSWLGGFLYVAVHFQFECNEWYFVSHQLVGLLYYSKLMRENGVSYGSTNISHVESHVGKTSLRSFLFCGLFPLDWTSSRWRLPVFQ